MMLRTISLRRSVFCRRWKSTFRPTSKAELAAKATTPSAAASAAQAQAMSQVSSSYHDVLGVSHEMAHELTTTTRPSHFEDWMENLRGGQDDAWLQGDRDVTWYTGQPPVLGECPGVGADGRIRSLPLPHLQKVT